jgi:hypothetical protein
MPCWDRLCLVKKTTYTGCKRGSETSQYRWLMPIILATWKAEVGRIQVPGQSGK